MNVRIRNWLRFLIAFIIFTIAFALVMDKLVMPAYVRRGKEIPLVNVLDRPIEEAEALLKLNGFHVEIVDSVENPGLTPGTVVDQMPAPGNYVKQGRVVRLVLVSGEHFFPMPNLIGKVLKAARLQLERNKIRIDSVTYRYSSDKPKGVIMEQTKTPGFMIGSKETVSLVVSKGPPPQRLKVPDLFGMNLESAKRHIRQAGFKMGSIRYIPNDELTAYTVIGQSPEWGTLYDNPVEIDLEVTIDIQDEE